MSFTIKKKATSGFTLVEVIFACTIISLSVFAMMSAANKGIELSQVSLKQAQASFILEEGAEAVKTIRDSSWSSVSGLTLETSYYLSFDTNTNSWSLSTTPSNIDSTFTRTIIFSSVGRDANDDIVSSGGTIDDRTKKVTVTVTWPSGSGTLSRNLTFYIADIFS